MRLAVVSPGQVGSALAAALSGRGHELACALDGRSGATRERARALELRDAGSVGSLARSSDVIFSVCSPRASLGVAREAAGFRGVYVDANATSPETAAELGDLVRAAGGDYVDAAIIGRPPRAGGEARLYLSGDRASEIAALFEGTAFEARLLSAGPYSASALKLVHAAWSEGKLALLLASDAVARRLGVNDELRGEWERLEPGLSERLASSARSAATNAGRWSTEMEAVCQAFNAAGASDALPRGAAEVFSRLAQKLEPGDPGLLERIGSELTGPPRARSVPAHARPPAAAGRGLASWLRRPSDTMTLDELLESWGIALGAGESVRWFGPCGTQTSSGYAVITGRRLWYIDPDDQRPREERRLETIVAVDQKGGGRRQRLLIRGQDWQLELRSLGWGRSLAELAAILEPRLASARPSAPGDR